MVFCNKMFNILVFEQVVSHNPYFNRWFSAMNKKNIRVWSRKGHNPYFNRWFSAIPQKTPPPTPQKPVTILILIDGFLQ